MIKKGNQVEILCGKDKGKKGEVIEISRIINKVKVKGLACHSGQAPFGVNAINYAAKLMIYISELDKSSEWVPSSTTFPLFIT